MDLGLSGVSETEFGISSAADLGHEEQTTPGTAAVTSGLSDDAPWRGRERRFRRSWTGKGKDVEAALRKLPMMTGKEKDKEMVVEMGSPQIGRAMGVKKSGRMKEGTWRETCEEVLTTTGPLMQGWENPRAVDYTSASMSRKRSNSSPTGTGTLRKSGATTTAAAASLPSLAKLQFGLLRTDPAWLEFGEVLSRAQAGSAPGEGDEGPGTIVDFGPLTFVEPGLDLNADGQKRNTNVIGEEGEVDSGVWGSREREVRMIFGLGDLDIWSA